MTATNSNPAPKTSTIMWTAETALAAYQSRRKFSTNDVENEQRIIVRITGNGNVIDVLDGEGNHVVSPSTGEVLTKKIFNTNATNPYALGTPRVEEYRVEALKAQKAGDKQRAADYFNAWLNATNLSFSVLSNTPEFNTLGKGDEIVCNLQKVTTDNGTLATINPKGIKVNLGSKGTTATDNPFAMEVEDETSETVQQEQTVKA